MMNIERCEPPCLSADDKIAGVTLAGIELLRRALDLRGRPDVVEYTDVVDAFAPKVPAARRGTRTDSRNFSPSGSTRPALRAARRDGGLRLRARRQLQLPKGGRPMKSPTCGAADGKDEVGAQRCWTAKLAYEQQAIVLQCGGGSAPDEGHRTGSGSRTADALSRSRLHRAQRDAGANRRGANPNPSGGGKICDPLKLNDSVQAERLHRRDPMTDTATPREHPRPLVSPRRHARAVGCRRRDSRREWARRGDRGAEDGGLQRVPEAAAGDTALTWPTPTALFSEIDLALALALARHRHGRRHQGGARARDGDDRVRGDHPIARRAAGAGAGARRPGGGLADAPAAACRVAHYRQTRREASGCGRHGAPLGGPPIAPMAKGGCATFQRENPYAI